MKGRLTFQQLVAKTRKIEWAVAAYVTRYGKIPKARLQPSVLAEAADQLPLDSELRVMLLQRIQKIDANFDQWVEVFDATRHWNYDDRARDRYVPEHALQQCLRKARSFQNWLKLSTVYISTEYGGDKIRTEAQQKMVETAESFTELLTALIAGCQILPKSRRLMMDKLKAVASDREWLSLLADSRDRFKTDRTEKGMVFEKLAVQTLLDHVNSFTDYKRILDALPFEMKNARRLILRRMVQVATSRSDWKEVKRMAGKCSAVLERRADQELMQRARTFREWQSLMPSTRKGRQERFKKLRRLARKFNDWMEIYSWSRSPKDLEQMKKLGTLEDWADLYCGTGPGSDNALLAARNEMLASCLK